MSTVVTGEPTAIGGGDRLLEAGETVGEYVIQEKLGQGGFGTVYRAVQPLIGKQVAIKVLGRRYSSDDAIVQRFVDEARAVNQIRHRNIIDIFSFGQLPDGRHYYVMELLDGTPLDQHLKATGALRLDETLPVLRALARALDAAHAKGIAHRDLKPENIVLSFDDEGQSFPKLLDFGIAKLSTPDQERVHRTGTGVPLGTPYYMSPEQCRGRDVDHRTDIYSFGVLTFRLLTGDYPFHGELIEILHQHMHEEPPLASSKNPSLTPTIDRAIAWMMAKDPAQRPPSLAAAVAALQGDTSAPTPARITPMPGRQRASSVASADTIAAATGNTMPEASAGKPATRGRGWLALAALVLVASAGVAGYLVTRPVATGESEPAPVAAPTPAPVTPVERAATPAPPPVEPPAPPVSPAHVIVTLADVPEGAEVKIQNETIGVAPKVQVPRGTTTVVLTVYANGYLPKSVELVPDADQTLKVVLKKPRRNAPAPHKDDIIRLPNVPGLRE